ncbi:MAG: nucleotidyltransferase family protein [Pseudomonadota bacterium]|nr:nucleotidyltransferase family protein [Pseudomonadota bacterium]
MIGSVGDRVDVPEALSHLPAPARALLDLTAPDPRVPPAATDWRAVLAAAEHHRVVLPLAHGLGMTGLLDLPGDAAAAFRVMRDRATYITVAAVMDLLEIKAALDSAGCAWCVIKGLPLSVAMYGDVAGRDVGDIDIMVAEADMVAAVRALSATGFVSGPAGALVSSSRQVRRLLHAANDLAFHTPGRTKLELHWRWSRNPWLPPLDVGRTLASGRTERVGSVDIPVPEPVEHFIYLCVHGLRHRWHRLKWLNDIRETLAWPDWIGADWHQVVERAEALGAARALAVSLVHAHWIDGVPLPGPVQAVMRRDPDCLRLATDLAEDLARQFSAGGDRPTDPGLRGVLREMRLGWRVSTDGRARRHAVLSRPFLLPTENDLLMLDLPRGLDWTWPAVRPALWALRQARRQT